MKVVVECVSIDMSKIALVLPVSVEEKNLRVLEYIHGRLGDKTSQGQCILHINPGGEIRRIEWRETENSDDVIKAL